jgi:dUTP pyrophosphatase
MNDDLAQIQFQKLNELATLPTRGSEMAAGLDLYAAESGNVPVGGYTRITTGIAVAIPSGYYGRIAPRSGLAAKHGIDTLAGVIDSDYRGELVCVLANHGDKEFEIKPGDRVAQFIIERIIIPTPEWAGSLPDTARGEAGLGSTGY